MKKQTGLFYSLFCLTLSASLIACETNQVPSNSSNSETSNSETKTENEVTIADAIALATEAGENGTSIEYVITGTISEISSYDYGAMTITDETGSLYVYGVYGSDRTTKYSGLSDKPLKGDTITLIGKLKTYNGSPEMDRGYIVSFTHNDVEVDLTQYIERSISDARVLEDGYKMKVSGVVAYITYGQNYAKNGFYLVDDESSIYVYGPETAAQVEVGNTVSIAGIKDYYVLETEATNAAKFGYKGSCQLSEAILLENDKGETTPNLSWVSETTIKDLIATPVNQNITTNIYKVNSYVKKVPGNGFTNYYFYDLDGTTGSYTYTMNNGNDFSWIDEFDGKICTVYLSPINCKSDTTTCFYRFVPIKIVDENYVFDLKNAPSFALKYYANNQFKNRYTIDPEIEVITNVSSNILNFENLTLSYASSNTSSVYFEEKDGKTIMHTNQIGQADVTITAYYQTYSATSKVSISVEEPKQLNTISIAQAIAAEDEEVVTVKGVVTSSVVNRPAFYLTDETGIIAVHVDNEAMFKEISLGDEIAVTGKREYFKKETSSVVGQTCITNAVLEENYFGNHTYNSSLFVEKTMAEILSASEDASTVDLTYTGYKTTAYVKVEDTQYYSNIYLADPNNHDSYIRLYCSSSSQYSFLKAYKDQDVTVELMLCNWNDKTYYTGCVVSIITDYGKEINSLNFR